MPFVRIDCDHPQQEQESRVRKSSAMIFNDRAACDKDFRESLDRQAGLVLY